MRSNNSPRRITPMNPLGVDMRSNNSPRRTTPMNINDTTPSEDYEVHLALVLCLATMQHHALPSRPLDHPLIPSAFFFSFTNTLQYQAEFDSSHLHHLIFLDITQAMLYSSILCGEPFMACGGAMKYPSDSYYKHPQDSFLLQLGCTFQAKFSTISNTPFPARISCNVVQCWVK